MEPVIGFTVATDYELEKAILLAEKASETYMQMSGIKKADFLDAISNAIMNLGDELIEKCAEETALSTESGYYQKERGHASN